jgi:hypothetical protein
VELVVALAICAFGLLVAWDSYRTGSGWSAMSGPRAGYFPFRLGLLLALCGAVVAVQTLRKRGSLRLRFIEPGQIGPVLTVAIPSVIYVAGIQWLGIYVASFVFVAAFMRWVGRLAWWRCLLVAVCLVVLMFWLFEKRFFLPLPKGPLEAWLGIY